MTHRDPTATDTVTESEPTTPAETEAEIAHTREQLGEIVRALSDKLDVKARAGRKMRDARSRGQHVVERAWAATRDKEGRPNDVIPVGGALAAMTLGAIVVSVVGSRKA